MKRFGMAPKESKEELLEKKRQRAERFGTAVKEVELQKRKKRIERFGQDSYFDAMRQRKRAKH